MPLFIQFNNKIIILTIETSLLQVMKVNLSLLAIRLPLKSYYLSLIASQWLRAKFKQTFLVVIILLVVRFNLCGSIGWNSGPWSSSRPLCCSLIKLIFVVYGLTEYIWIAIQIKTLFYVSHTQAKISKSSFKSRGFSKFHLVTFVQPLNHCLLKSGETADIMIISSDL